MNEWQKLGSGQHVRNDRLWVPLPRPSCNGPFYETAESFNLWPAGYLTKPCTAREVLATVRAALRQRRAAGTSDDRQYRFDGWRIDVVAREVFNPDGALVDLTDGEFAVLRTFVERPRRVLSRDTLLDAARVPDSEAYDRAIDVQVSRLRRKLGNDDLIRTIRNEGYFFVPRVTRE